MLLITDKVVITMKTDYDQWLQVGHNEPTDDEPCELCGKDLTDCERKCHEANGYCYCYNSDCTNPEPK